MAGTPVLPEAIVVDVLSAQLRRRRTRSRTAAVRRFATFDCLGECCAPGPVDASEASFENGPAQFSAVPGAEREHALRDLKLKLRRRRAHQRRCPPDAHRPRRFPRHRATTSSRNAMRFSHSSPLSPSTSTARPRSSRWYFCRRSKCAWMAPAISFEFLTARKCPTIWL
jgi:hypothetical protein